jgi:hypothetical protein
MGQLRWIPFELNPVPIKRLAMRNLAGDERRETLYAD